MGKRDGENVRAVPNININMTGWNKIIGHQWAVDLLRGAIVHGHVGHAYLVTGMAQVGKTMLLRTFAQALNCTQPDLAQRPCEQCRSCQLIAQNRHPDVRLLQPEMSGRGYGVIKIEQIRAFQSDLSLATYEGRYKVGILRQFEAANVNAANAFLKTLEEPPAKVILLLTAADAEGVLPTIQSRCRTIALRPLSLQLVEEVLQSGWKVPASQAKLLAHLSGGRLGWAVNAGTTPKLLQERTADLKLLQTALKGSLVERFELADKLAKQPEELPARLQTWLTWWRDVALVQWQQGEQMTNLDEEGMIRESAGIWTTKQTLHSLNQTQQALWQLQRNANTRLVVENLFLNYPEP